MQWPAEEENKFGMGNGNWCHLFPPSFVLRILHSSASSRLPEQVWQLAVTAKRCRPPAEMALLFGREVPFAVLQHVRKAPGTLELSASNQGFRHFDPARRAGELALPPCCWFCFCQDTPLLMVPWCQPRRFTPGDEIPGLEGGKVHLPYFFVSHCPVPLSVPQPLPTSRCFSFCSLWLKAFPKDFSLAWKLFSQIYNGNHIFHSNERKNDRHFNALLLQPNARMRLEFLIHSNVTQLRKDLIQWDETQSFNAAFPYSKHKPPPRHLLTGQFLLVPTCTYSY